MPPEINEQTYRIGRTVLKCFLICQERKYRWVICVWKFCQLVKIKSRSLFERSDCSVKILLMGAQQLMSLGTNDQGITEDEGEEPNKLSEIETQKNK